MLKLKKQKDGSWFANVKNINGAEAKVSISTSFGLSVYYGAQYFRRQCETLEQAKQEAANLIDLLKTKTDNAFDVSRELAPHYNNPNTEQIDGIAFSVITNESEFDSIVIDECQAAILQVLQKYGLGDKAISYMGSVSPQVASMA